MCAGAIGFRSLRLAKLEDGQALGLTGFGASAHLVLKLVRHRFPGTEVFVFARSAAERAFARELGAAWAGETSERAPRRLDAIIDTTPAWTPVVEALANLERGGAWSSTQFARKTAIRTLYWVSTIPLTSGWRRKSRASPTSPGPT